MSKDRGAQVLGLHPLTPSQEMAAGLRGKDLIVTAGAGSGKTRTLVARYLALLAEGAEIRRIAAITFTDKAAREMRNRVRADLEALQAGAEDESDRAFWREKVAEIDAARIGTIHSLCAEILRTHPAEAGVDPDFGMLDESQMALLKREAVQLALAWAVEQPGLGPLFAQVPTATLKALLVKMLNERLDYEDLGRSPLEPGAMMLGELARTLVLEDFQEPLLALRELEAAGKLDADAGAVLAGRVRVVLSCWSDAQAFLAGGDLVGAAAACYRMRRQGLIGGAGSKSSLAKAVHRDLQAAYDALLDPWIGGKNSKDPPPDPGVEAALENVLPLFRQAADAALREYERLREGRRALDFDDLESIAARVLKNPGVQRAWQERIAHLLVDEFQDTNQRQRDIVLALAGQGTGKLFLVGDAQQSIYRFRGADVEVFVGMRDEIRARGGESLRLETTFRSHKPLLDCLDSILAPVIDEAADPGRPYAVPYQRMQAFRADYQGPYQEPFVEVILGKGDDDMDGRTVAARALVDRLIALKQAGQIGEWSDAALLFRASSGYLDYESALSEAGVPFVTVAGVGFYDRPEIRDVLNILQAAADPWNDTAMAGFLRSPAIGLADAGLYRLRVGQDGEPRPLKTALQDYESLLPPEEQRAAAWALEVLDEFTPVANHLPVAELLYRLVNRLDYRAILMSVGQRAVRNLDKLLEDALESGLLHVSAFLEYVRSIKASGVRAGEAPSDAEGSLQLMTIHKAKGLEFPLVVLADAGRASGGRSESGYLFPDLGLSIKMAGADHPSLLYKYASQYDKEREAAEALRLLYVACTRDQDKLIVSGHLGAKDSVRGYLKTLGIDYGASIDSPGEVVVLGDRYPLRLITHTPKHLAGLKTETPLEVTVDRSQKHLYKAVVEPVPLLAEADAADLNGAEEEFAQERSWRATAGRHAPALVVGVLVHRALQRWTFPGDVSFEALMLAELVRAGVVTQGQREAVLKEVRALLDRFRGHEIFEEIRTAAVRRHEVPYAMPGNGGRLEMGVIDLLYLGAHGWEVLDFKTDEIRDAEAFGEKVEAYLGQVRRYRRAVRSLVGEAPRTRLCFLDDRSGVGFYQL